jgi:transcriptional regulator GlxA family with amidase domain
MRFQNSEDVQIFRILIRIDGWEGSPIMALDRRRLEANDAARVLEYIGDNLADDLRLSELAALAGMSPDYFCELFKKSMGYPPYRFVLLQRMERAKELLRNPELTVLNAHLPLLCAGAGSGSARSDPVVLITSRRWGRPVCGSA